MAVLFCFYDYVEQSELLPNMKQQPYKNVIMQLREDKREQFEECYSQYCTGW